MGAPERGAPGRARAGPRHADGRRAARARSAAGLPRGAVACIWSRSARSCAARSSRRCRRSPAFHGTQPRREVPDGPRSSSPTNSSMRCRCISSSRTTTAGTSAWSASTATAACLRAHARSDAAFDRRCRRASSAPTGAIFEWRDDQPIAALARRIARHGGAALVIDYGHAQSGVGETLQAVQRSRVRRSARRSRRGRPHRACRFRARSAARRERRARARTVRSRKANSCAGSASGNAPTRLESERDAAAGAPTSMPRSRASPRRRRDGRAVQGAGDRRSEARRAAGV